MVSRDLEDEKYKINSLEKSVLGLLIALIIIKAIAVCSMGFELSASGSKVNASFLFESISELLFYSGILFALYIIVKILFDIYLAIESKGSNTNLSYQRSTSYKANIPVQDYGHNSNDKVVCPMCGYLNMKGDLFCGNCGRKVR